MAGDHNLIQSAPREGRHPGSADGDFQDDIGIIHTVIHAPDVDKIQFARVTHGFVCGVRGHICGVAETARPHRG